MRLVAFCEAPSDYRMARDLIDRVLRERGATWIRDVMESAPDGIRSFEGDGQGREYFDLHKLGEYTSRLGLRAPQGHFDGRPGAAGAMMARTVFVLARALEKTRGALDAVVLLWDMDDEPRVRREGLEQARREAVGRDAVRIVLGCPNAMREAWVLVGFEPGDADEASRVAVLRQELGFSPIDDAHQLDSNDETAKRSPKRVLRALTRDDPDRETRCWLETSLEALRARGGETGLARFLTEIEEQLLPLCGRGG